MFGYRYDTETGLYYLQSRYYNPDWGRFINADAEGGKVGDLLSHNAFAYCGNNPVNRFDPNGNSWGIIGEFFQQLSTAIKTLTPAFAAAGASELELGIGTMIGLGIAVFASVGVIGVAGYQTYKAITNNSSAKSKTKSVPIPINNSNKQKPKYWKADYNQQTKNIDIGVPITQDEAIERVAQNKSVLCANANKALQVARNFQGYYPEINKGEYGSPDFYPHYHINWGHGDPHIWFFPGLN